MTYAIVPGVDNPAALVEKLGAVGSPDRTVFQDAAKLDWRRQGFRQCGI